jgi:proline dehydrogenase
VGKRTILSRKLIVASVADAVGKLYALSPKNLSEGIAVCQGLARHGIRSTLGKFSSVRDSPEAIVREHLRASDALKHAVPGVFYLSIKPPALAFDLDLVAEVVATARSNGHGSHFDSHGYDVVDPTLALLDRTIARAAASEMSAVGWFGLTVPSRWKRSRRDAEWALEREVRIRLVQGEFPAELAADESDPADSFLALVDQIAGRASELTIATHDVGLARAALERCRGSKTLVRLELLYGFPSERPVSLAREVGVQPGFYVPYGSALLVYAIRHLLRNPHKLSRGNYAQALRGNSARLTRTIELVQARDAS